MVVSSIQLARQIAVYSYLNPKQDVGEIASAFGLPPIYLINALNKGTEEGLFTTKRGDAGYEDVTVSKDQYDSVAKIPSNFGEPFEDFCGQLYELVSFENGRQQDIIRDYLQMWSAASPAVFEVAMAVLLSGVLKQYLMFDPVDRKSSYRFVSLSENADKKWGSKQFKKKKATAKKKRK